MSSTEALDLQAALDPVRFARALGFDSLDPWQPGALRWTGKRLLLNVHRQGGKSTVAAVLALHEAIYKPGSLTLLVSPSLRQSTELYRKVADLMDRLPDPPKLTEDSKTTCTFENKSRIVSLPSSESTIRGYSNAGLVIEDESARVHDDLHRAVRPMLATSGGRLILMSTPFGKRGHYWEAWDRGGDTLERIQAAAANCPRIDRAFLAEERRALGATWYAQEYECAFVEAEGAVFHREILEACLDPNVKPYTWRSKWGQLMEGG